MNLLFVRQLTVIDFSYLHPSRGLVGESWIVDVDLHGELDAQGMVFDFGLVKKVIKSGIDQALDHKLAIPRRLPGLELDERETWVGARLPLAQGGEILHEAPAQAVALLDLDEITPEGVAPWLARHLKSLLPDNVRHIDLQLRPERIEGAFYHYSHGLKKHAGNCQRIAHGHRSRLEILQDGQRNEQLERDWAAMWRDIYIGTREDIVARPVIQQIEHTEFQYRADQGDFRLRIPSRQVYLLGTDSTVEWIAQHIAQQLKAQMPASQFLVRAFEGVDKGSVAKT